MLAFVLGNLGIARLFWAGSLGCRFRGAGWVAALFYAGNANLEYLQSTAMTEPLSLALFVWAAVLFAEFLGHLRRLRSPLALSWEREAEKKKGARALRRCAIFLAAGMLTRYDHWMFAAAVWTLSCAAIWWSQRDNAGESSAPLWRAWRSGAGLCALAAALWLAYNFGTYGNALEFANGPYSARAIAQQSSSAEMPRYPGEHNLQVAAIYYFKSAELNASQGRWEWLLLILTFAGTAALISKRHWALAVLLWLPFFFYAVAVAFLSVPIFMPQWWPFSFYNVRYGIELLPALAIFSGLAFAMLRKLHRARLRLAARMVFVALVCGMLASAWSGAPLCLREARVNSVSRLAFERQLSAHLAKLPPGSSVLMYTGNHVGALQMAGLHLARTINENNGPLWRQALAHPSAAAEYVIAMQGDDVWKSVQQHPEDLTAIAEIAVQGEPYAVLYASTFPKKTKRL
jgi:hypothetical protein